MDRNHEPRWYKAQSGSTSEAVTRIHHHIYLNTPTHDLGVSVTRFVDDGQVGNTPEDRRGSKINKLG